MTNLTNEKRKNQIIILLSALDLNTNQKLSSSVHVSRAVGELRAHLHPATATSLPNLIYLVLYCYTKRFFFLLLLGNHFVSHSVAMSQRHCRRVAVTGCKWRSRRAPLTDQNCFNFMGFFKKSIKYVGSAPASKELAPPPTTSAASAPAEGALVLHTLHHLVLFSSLSVNCRLYLGTDKT